MSVYFITPGEIDPRLISTLGVNVKENSSPIGFFGTGLKYAISVLLREGQEISIRGPNSSITFSLNEDEIRGKKFNFILMHEASTEGCVRTSQLGFTAELGKNWTLADAYRELYSNTKDENGRITSSATFRAAPTETIITVSGEAFDDVYANRHEIILDEERNPKILQLCPLALHKESTNKLFYKGIAAYTLPSEALFTYNILDTMPLSEDRKILDPFLADTRILNFFTRDCSDETLIEQVLLTKGTYEEKLDFSELDWSETFTRVAGRLVKTNIMELDSRIATKFFTNLSFTDHTKEAEISLSAEMSAALRESIETLKFSKFSVTKYPIKVLHSLPQNVLALADRKSRTILLSATLFRTKYLTEALLEEFLHLECGVEDESREMQSLLFRLLVTEIRLRKAQSNDTLAPF